jgi:hypothetical protein
MRKILILGILVAMTIASIGLVTAGNGFGPGDGECVNNKVCDGDGTEECDGNCKQYGEGDDFSDGQCDGEQKRNQYNKGNCNKNMNNRGCCNSK